MSSFIVVDRFKKQYLDGLTPTADDALHALSKWIVHHQLALSENDRQILDGVGSFLFAAAQDIKWGAPFNSITTSPVELPSLIPAFDPPLPVAAA